MKHTFIVMTMAFCAICYLFYGFRTVGWIDTGGGGRRAENINGTDSIGN
jgi:hypothetical protein